jgi:hypothetical protein
MDPDNDGTVDKKESNAYLDAQFDKTVDKTDTDHDRTLDANELAQLSNLFRGFSSKLPQNRHPERSASQIYRVTQRLWRGVEGPRRCLFTHAVRSFSTNKPAPGGPEFKDLAQSRGWKTITVHEKMYP